MIASFINQARFILAIGLLLGQVIRVSSQGTTNASDLPSCASSCASTAATAVGCDLTDTTCLCSHSTFSTATRTCAGSVCGAQDSNSVNEVLSNMCSAASPNNTTSAPSSSGTATSQSASGSQGTNPPNSSSHSTGNNTSSVSVGVSYVTTQSQSSSSTVVVTQTVALPQSTNFSGTISHDFGFGVVGMGVVGQVVVALVGGLLLLL